mgnify:CR=1 FL=1|jgi:hypothetical protein
MYRKTITLCFILLFVLLITSVAGASDSIEKPKSAEEVQTLLIAAQNGDINAAEKILSLDAFNKEKVDEVLKGVKVDGKEGSREFKFSDGSSICITVGSLGTNQLMESSEPVQPDTVHITNYGLHQWRAFGIEIARYIIRCKFRPDPGLNYCTHVDNWDEAQAAPGYTPCANGTYLEGPEFGHNLYIRGSGGFSSIAGSGEISSVGNMFFPLVTLRSCR